MTETEWIASTNPKAMLECLWEMKKLIDRRNRLFAVACCRRAWGRRPHARLR